jgi:hypothetical protein
MKFNVVSDTSAAFSLLMALQVSGSNQFIITKSGAIYGGGSTGWGITGSNALFTCNNNGAMQLSNSGAGLASVTVGGTAGLGFMLAGTQAGTGAPSVFLTAPAVRNLRLGQADAATALAQTLSVQSVVAGAITNPAGADFTITGSQGLGSGAGGSIIFKVAPAGTAGVSSQNALATALTISSDKSATFTSGVTTLNVNTTQTITPAIANLLAPSLAVGNTAYLNLGREGNTKNWAGFGFYYAGNGSSSNAFTLAFYGTVNLWGITADTTNTLMFLGGQTSSFPALKRSSTTLQARLADDSAFASVQGKLTTDTAYTAGALVATGYITIYDSTGTAYRVPCLV